MSKHAVSGSPQDPVTERLKTSRVVIASHLFASGPALELETYLTPRVAALLFLGHPFSFRADRRSHFRLFQQGVLVRTHFASDRNTPEVIRYAREAWLTLWWVLRSRTPWDLYVGADGFLAFLGLLLQRLGRVRQVILYTIDFVPRRFENPVLHWLYTTLDSACLRSCHRVWNVSGEITAARARLRGISRERACPQLTVPLGIWHARIPKLSLAQKQRYQLVFVGHLLEKNGVQVVLEALPLVRRVLPDIRFLVMGSGPYAPALKERVAALHLGDVVTFTGYVERHEDVEHALAKSAVGVAMYKPERGSFTYYADPGKIKNYLSAGLGVILTDVPPIAQDLVRQGCGRISAYDPRELCTHIVSLLSDSSLLEQYRTRAIAYASHFDWERIFHEALLKSDV